VTSSHQELIPPSLSNSSLLSASSETSWQSVSSTSSRKHDLELPFEVSPRAKRRLLVDTHSVATASSRYSAPYIQNSSDMDRSDKRRVGLLRRSGAPMQSFHPVSTNGISLPPIHSNSAAAANGGNASLDSFPRPPQRYGVSIPSAPLQSGQRGEQRGVPKRSRHSSAWPLTSPSAISETAVPEPGTQQGDDLTNRNRDRPIPGSQSDKRMAYVDTSSSPGPFLAPDPAPQRAVSADLSDFKGAQRLDAFLTLEGNKPNGRLLSQGGSGSRGEETHITVCGNRPYGEWIGSWSKSICSSCFLSS
jgi:hypothetical protein